MLNQDRCPSLNYDELSGESIQCEGERGHNSAHYAGDTWWPNRRGFPNNMASPPWFGCMLLTGIVVLFIIIFSFIITR